MTTQTIEQVVQWAGSVVGVTDEILTYYSLDADELVKFTDLDRADLEATIAGLQKTNAELDATFKEETAKKWAEFEATIAEQAAEIESLRVVIEMKNRDMTTLVTALDPDDYMGEVKMIDFLNGCITIAAPK